MSTLPLASLRLPALALLCALSLSPARADDLPSLPPGRCVLDLAHALDAASLSQLEAACERFDKSGTGQLAVAVVPTFGERGRDQYANELFAQWKLGHKGRDDGLLVVLKAGPPGQRAIRVEVGYGFEGALPDGKVGALIDELALPQLKEGRFGPGLVPLVDALIAVGEKENAAGAIKVRQLEKQRRVAEAGRLGVVTGILLTAWLGWLLLLLVFRVTKRLPGKLAKLSGYASAGSGGLLAIVAGGENRGAAVVMFAVLAGLVAFAFWAVARHRCPTCGKWMAIQSTTLASPTYTSTGVEEIVQRCESCAYVSRTKRTLPRRQRTTTTSGYGGSSHGGGRSSGGGGFSGGGGGSSGGGGAGRSF